MARQTQESTPPPGKREWMGDDTVIAQYVHKIDTTFTVYEQFYVYLYYTSTHTHTLGMGQHAVVTFN